MPEVQEKTGQPPAPAAGDGKGGGVHDRSTDLGQRLHDKYGLDGAEVTDAVFGSQRSIVFDQAENRLHTIKAVLVAALAR
jgi:ornithine carbamoyltransferase